MSKKVIAWGQFTNDARSTDKKGGRVLKETYASFVWEIFSINFWCATEVEDLKFIILCVRIL